jgi:16S rRNA (cytidine1402-2'-O)-methyltransferase
VAVARELTKLHEEVLRGRASEVLTRLTGVDLKGEVALVIGGAPAAPTDDVTIFIPEAEQLVESGMRKREAAHEVAERHGVSANALYRALLEVPPPPEGQLPSH